MAISIMVCYSPFVQRAWHLRKKTDLVLVWITIFQKLPKMYGKKGALGLTTLERVGNTPYIARSTFNGSMCNLFPEGDNAYLNDTGTFTNVILSVRVRRNTRATW